MMRFFTLWVAGLLLTQLAAQGQNVGIGTTSPTQTLDVNGQLRVRGLSGAGGGLPQVQPDGTLGLYSPTYSAASDPYAAQPVLLNPNPAGGTTGGTPTGRYPRGVAVSGTTACVVNGGSNTLQVFDVSTPASPFLEGSVGTDSSPRGVAVSGTAAYVVNINDNTLQVFDVSTPTSPVLKGSIGTGSSPISVAVSGTTVYVVNIDDNTLQVFDVSIPTSPILKGSIGTGNSPYSVAVSGTTAYVVNIDDNTLQVFDVSTPASPVLKGSVGTGSGPHGVAVSGTAAYVVNGGSNTLQVFDVSTPASPALKGSVGTGSNPISVAVSGTAAYVVNLYSNTLQVFDVGTPTSPLLKGSVNTSYPFDMAVSGSTAYVVGNSTLQVFQVSSVRALGLQVDGSLGLASAPLLTLSGQNLGISGGNTVTLPTQPGDNLGNHTATRNLDLATYQLVGNGGSQGLSIGSGGSVGIGTGTASPASLLANTSGNVIGSDGFGVSAPSLTWISTQQGYTAALYNDNTTGAGGGGLAVKVASNGPGTAALDVSRGSQAAAGTTLLRVRADGNVGIGTSSPAATLDVAGYTRLAGAGVPAGASGASVPAVAVLELDATLSTVAGGQVLVAHGLSDANILSVTALAAGATGNTIPPGFALNGNGELYGVYLNGNRVVLQNGPAGTSAGVLGKAVRVVITYRQ